MNRESFHIDLARLIHPHSHIRAVSGISTIGIGERTVCSARNFIAPPYTAGDLKLDLAFEVNGNPVNDSGDLGKGDCGLLFSGGTWQLGQIVRRGTYHHLKGNDRSPTSFAVVSRLVPLFLPTQPLYAFALEISVSNRSSDQMECRITPELSDADVCRHEISDFDFAVPRTDSTSGKSSRKAHQRFLYTEQRQRIASGETKGFYIGFEIADAADHFIIDSPDCLPAFMDSSLKAWDVRVKALENRFPSFVSDDQDLNAYYLRALCSGLVSGWEHPDFFHTPYLATGGVDGGAVCSYPWDIAGYCHLSSNLFLGRSTSKTYLNRFLSSESRKHSRFAPDGSWKDVFYAYNLWSAAAMFFNHHKIYGKDEELYRKLVRHLKKIESESENAGGLIDYGVNSNLLEMRSCAWEHLTASPNAERAWIYRQLSILAGEYGDPDGRLYAEKADSIERAVIGKLWDKEKGWFKCIHPGGHEEYVYSIQAFDVLACGFLPKAIEERIVGTLNEDQFLGPFGIHSIAKSDDLHFDCNDPDWSGGGAYGGEAGRLVADLFKHGYPEQAEDILQRILWTGRHFAYIPQEYMAEAPKVPEYKRANIVSGLNGTEAVLSGICGVEILYDGQIKIDLHRTTSRYFSLTGLIVQGRRFDILKKNDNIKVYINGQLEYDGDPQPLFI